MFAFLRWIIGLSGALILLYAIAINPQTVTLNWYPAAAPIETPLYSIIIAVFIVGYLIGTLYLWLNQLPKHIAHNKERKQNAKRIKQLEKELDAHQTEHISDFDTE